MKVLLVKTSSLGDVIHALPAVTEAFTRLEDFSLDWLVEEGFADIPRLHPRTGRVIPVALRRWRGDPLASLKQAPEFVRSLRRCRYDLVLDSQGLVKSSLLAALARGPASGFDRRSAREGGAAWLYRSAHFVAAGEHAIVRQKRLFALALGYEPGAAIDYGLNPEGRPAAPENAILLLHGATWRSKQWPLAHWRALAGLIADAGYRLLLPAAGPVEAERARSILGGRDGELLAGLSLGELAARMRPCAGAVAVDTGPGHLAAALGLPLVGIFGATDPGLTGFTGAHSSMITSDNLPCIPCRKRECRYQNSDISGSIYPPCYEQNQPEAVWQALQLQIDMRNTAPG